MSIASAAGAISSGVNSFSDLLGLDGWSLSDGKYNGCSFTAFVDGGVLGNSTAARKLENAVGQVEQAFGATGGDDANDSSQLYQTFLTSIQYSDKLIPQIVVKKKPYSSSANIEDMGFAGREFSMTLFFFGDDYKKAADNFINVIVNPPTDTSIRRVLEHPVWGKIDGNTYVTSYEAVTSWREFKAATINITFRSESSTPNKEPKQSILQKILRGINTVAGVITGLDDAARTSGLLLNSVTSYFKADPDTQNNALNSYNSTVSTLNNSTTFVYKTSGVATGNTKFDKQKVNYSLLPVSLSSNPSYTDTTGNIIMNDYINKVNATIALLKALPDSWRFSNLINLLNYSIVSLYDIIDVLVDNRKTYTTTKDSTIIELLADIGYSFNDAYAIMLLNPQLLSANYIPAGSMVYI